MVRLCSFRCKNDVELHGQPRPHFRSEPFRACRKHWGIAIDIYKRISVLHHVDCASNRNCLDASSAACGLNSTLFSSLGASLSFRVLSNILSASENSPFRNNIPPRVAMHRERRPGTYSGMFTLTRQEICEVLGRYWTNVCSIYSCVHYHSELSYMPTARSALTPFRLRRAPVLAHPQRASTSWNYVKFLDYAADRILLRKVGGGYLFSHRMLLEHFAARYVEPGSPPRKDVLPPTRASIE